MDWRAAEASPGTRDHAEALCRGYLAFARDNPAHYRLLFRTDAIDSANPSYQAAAHEAFARLATAVADVEGQDDEREPINALSIWSAIHGLADLLLAGQVSSHTDDDAGRTADRLVALLVERLISPER